ncbi:MAG TPA: EI24 domain-containing protein [Micromonosporaceae bacterium]
MSSAMRDFATGARMLGEGFTIMARHKRLWLVGTVPALLAFLLVTSVLIGIGLWAGDLVAWATPFADEWPADTREALRITATVVLMLAVIGVAVVTFSAVTLLIGGPFYEYIAEQIEDRTGNKPPGYHASWFRMFIRGLRDSVLLVTISVLLTLPLFCLSFVPVLGQTVIPVLASSIGGWILALELVGVPFHRRGLRLGDRHRALRTRPALALGLGVPTYLICAIPFAAIVVMPVAAASGTLLARAVLSGPPPVPARRAR